MTDCNSPKCHEHITTELANRPTWTEFTHLKDCAAKKVPKKTAWIAMWSILVVIGIPLFCTGVKVWSQQESDHLRFVEKTEMVEHERAQIKLQEVVRHLSEDMSELKAGQKEVMRDVKEILRNQRGK